MDPYESPELHDRWDALMVRMLRLFSKLNIIILNLEKSLNIRLQRIPVELTIELRW